ncbi:MAG: sulfate adenylyltransferase [Bacillaceae bacterium]|nr:sulfate adenylyltransferase [Bacillaceae bacterium]
MHSITPHGGVLINRIADQELQKELMDEVEDLKQIMVDKDSICDIECISTGAFSPLIGFMDQQDYRSVVQQMRLSDGTLWPIPVTLPIDEEQAAGISIGEKVALKGEGGTVYAVLTVTDKFRPDKHREARMVYRTEDIRHPGVKKLFSRPDVYLGGPIDVINRPDPGPFRQVYLTPEDTRRIFKEMGWKKVVGFQTRNPVHRAHEYIQKAALETVDGLFLHPLVGETKPDDIPADIRMKSYQVLLEHYYPVERVVLGVFPGSMRYAGPREAVYHALIRKNYGCTHFIVGRDHAGVGDYYGTYDAHQIFRQFAREELEIVPLFFEHSFYCRRCEGMATFKTCPHPESDHLTLSGTRVRRMLKSGKTLPPEFTRPEVAQILLESFSQKPR